MSWSIFMEPVYHIGPRDCLWLSQILKSMVYRKVTLSPACASRLAAWWYSPLAPSTSASLRSNTSRPLVPAGAASLSLSDSDSGVDDCSTMSNASSYCVREVLI